MPVLPCLLLFAMPIAAANEGDLSFRMLDLDRDGQLSPREVAQLQLDFPVLDTNGNGYLSRNEIGRAGTRAMLTRESPEHSAAEPAAGNANQQ